MKRVIYVLLAVALLAACEKPVIDEQVAEGITLHFSCDGGITRAVEPIENVCSRLSVVFFQNGEKVKTITQKTGDESFGNVTVALQDGNYDVVAIAHNCNGTATVTSTEKVTFPSNRVTDTFYYYGSVSSGSQTQTCVMTRPVAMVRFEDVGSLPSGTDKLKFYYLGGSSTFSPESGFGCVNSKQTEERSVNDDGIYEIYTFPHTTEDVLTKVVITALDYDGLTLDEVTLENVPVTVNMVTKCNSSLFGGGSSSQGGFNLFAETGWNGFIEYKF